jgi:hypothetical protein
MQPGIGVLPASGGRSRSRHGTATLETATLGKLPNWHCTQFHTNAVSSMIQANVTQQGVGMRRVGTTTTTTMQGNPWQPGEARCWHASRPPTRPPAAPGCGCWTRRKTAQQVCRTPSPGCPCVYPSVLSLRPAARASGFTAPVLSTLPHACPIRPATRM